MFILANIIDAVTYLCHVAVVTYMIIVAVACAVSWFRITPYHPAVPRARETDGTRLFPRAQMDALRLLRGTGFFTRGCYCRTRAF